MANLSRVKLLLGDSLQSENLKKRGSKMSQKVDNSMWFTAFVTFTVLYAVSVAIPASATWAFTIAVLAFLDRSSKVGSFEPEVWELMRTSWPIILFMILCYNLAASHRDFGPLSRVFIAINVAILAIDFVRQAFPSGKIIALTEDHGE